ncbi:glycosyltransferase [Quadrisphaera sp. DSM 44207]|uniref:glycosyltransferase n=1 Tax=Quadrisphaera sp. DSM 44207 TaxID=1881057 RepID=UPI0008845794|nr:glycosyltransferase [Quadrisphaera sp. DSM 44207]SDQ68632.1 Glycosyltransferase involved in cell wall bisynthesis [Quadrisphaera sp. DSM 44207]
MVTPLRVTLLVHNAGTGAVARAQALTAVLEELGHTPRSVSMRGGQLWVPVRDTPFARTFSFVDVAGLEEVVATGTDLLLAVKPLSNSLGFALRLAHRHGVPLLADVDDPEQEVRTTYLPVREQLRRLVADPRLTVRRHQLRHVARLLPTTVSNPVLQAWYGGELVPHPRRDPGPGAPHTSDRPVLGFIGTVRDYKGVDELRDAVAELAGEGWRLRVTHEPPADPRPWEEWVGSRTTGTRRMLDTSDVVVVASAPEKYAHAQLPLKLVDAMLSGRAVVVSDTGPLPWAAGPGVPVVPHGDRAALVAVLRRLADPAERERVGAAARATALARYTPAAVAPAMQRAIDAAMARGGGLGPAVALLEGHLPRRRRRTTSTSSG